MSASVIPPETAGIELAGPAADDIRKSLGLSGGRRWLKWLVWLLVLGAVGTGGFYAYTSMSAPPPKPTFKTVPVERGDLVSSITATGSIQPVLTVDIGAEISGRIDEVLVAENDVVKKGQVLVRINTQRLDAERKSAQANLDAAKAGLTEARATWTEARAAEKRTKKLRSTGVSSQAAYEAARAARARASARIKSAKAQIALSQARLDTVNTDLANAVIVAPIDGVVLSRQVEPGSTVASSFQAPVLMTIAQDLSKMELRLDIDEADVGVVKAGQKATFGVDAFPDRTFEAELVSVWYASQTVSNVVTYRAVLTVDNDELLLRPGMTATATVVTEKVEDVLYVPNTALRFKPADALKGSGRRGPRMFGGNTKPTPEQRKRIAEMREIMKGPKVWILRDGRPRPVRVEPGRSDGTSTEVRTDSLLEGDEVITAVVQPKEGGDK